MKLLSTIKTQRQNDRQAQLYSDLIHREAKIGGELFGPVRPGGRREFFCLDKRTWIWHEEWIDPETNQRRVVTTRYDVRPNGIIKAQDGQGQRYISQEEARNLYRAVGIYTKRVGMELYGISS
jgi:hypothetical protein